ncbi:MAG: hypothetical protein R8M11_07750, partial [Gallionella sp.]
MKTSMTKVTVALAMLAISGVATAGIANTKHNLGSSANTANGGAGWNWTNATTEICVFCHTPHGADNQAAIPLWNRAVSTVGSYTTYASLGTSTLDAASVDPVDAGSVSLACLTCHDGTQAMDSMMNTPGSGNDPLVGTTNGANTGANGWVEFQSMSEISAEIIALGTDLSNDHPIAIQYAGAVDGHVALDPDFTAASSATMGNGGTVWYVETGVGGFAKDDLKLF